MNGTAQASSYAQLGWRFGIGVSLIVGGYAALALFPVVAAADLSLGFKTALSGLIAGTPALTKVAAIAVMGKPGFNFLKEQVFRYVGQLPPVTQVGRLRYRIGLVLFFLPLVFSSVEPYLPGLLIDWSANRVLYSLIGDVVMIISLFILGAGFWEKLRALFIYDAEIKGP